MRPGGAEVVDLTVSDDETVPRPHPRSKRPRMGDSDVVLVESDAGEADAEGPSNADMGDDEIRIVSVDVEVSFLYSYLQGSLKKMRHNCG